MFGIGKVTTRIEPCSKELFDEAIKAKQTKEICEMIVKMQKAIEQTTDEQKQKWCKQRISELKRSLPCITPMAHFKDNIRSVKNAILSGLNMLDVDHVDNPRQLWEEQGKNCPFPVALVHVTPSTRGLRIVFVQPQGETIEGAQLNVARALNVEYDACTKDLARCSFLVPESYIIERNDNLLFSDHPSPQHSTEGDHPSPQPVNSLFTPFGSPVSRGTETPEGEGADTSASERSSYNTHTTPSPSGEGKGRGVFPSSFKGIPYSDIVERILVHAGYDVTPTEGERNNALFMLARNLRYVCDFDVNFIMSVLPDWQLPENEVRSTVEHAVKSVRMTVMPHVLSETIKQMQKQAEMRDCDVYNNNGYVVEATGLIGEIIKTQPDVMKNAAYLTTITCLGTLLTRLRGHGCDGRPLAPNFMLCVSAPQATGKSFMKRIYEMVLAPVLQEDKRQRAEMQKIEKENRKNKDKDGYEEKEFEGTIRLLPTNTSNRILLERMDKAKGKHLMIMAEEIDSITKSEKSGRWSEKSDVYRLCYDNSEWGMDYASENSYHAVVRMFLNLLFSGTPAAVARFFSDIENGLVTRFLFIDLPDTYGQKRPKIMLMDDTTKEEIASRLSRLFAQMEAVDSNNGEDGFIWMDTTKMVEDAIEYYDEVQRKAYLLNQEDVCRDLARRRYADYAVKIMMIETWLNDGVYTEEIRDRAINVTNLCTEQLIANYGDELNKSLNESVDKQVVAHKRTKKQAALDLVPEEFTQEDFKAALGSVGGSMQSSRMVLTRLVKGKLVEPTEKRGHFRKLFA